MIPDMLWLQFVLRSANILLYYMCFWNNCKFDVDVLMKRNQDANYFWWEIKPF